MGRRGEDAEEGTACSVGGRRRGLGEGFDGLRVGRIESGERWVCDGVLGRETVASVSKLGGLSIAVEDWMFDIETIVAMKLRFDRQDEMEMKE